MKVKQIISIILVILWMTTVFGFSGQTGTGSSSLSKMVASKIVDIIDITNKMETEEKQEKIQIIEPIIRKLAHYAIYTLGGILFANLIYVFGKGNGQVVRYSISIIVGIVFAVTDEMHQLFVSGRSGRIEDVIIDSIGIITGLVVYILIRKIVDRIIDKSTVI